MNDILSQVKDVLSRSFFHNSLLDYLLAIFILVVGFLFVNVFKRVILVRIKRWTGHTHTHFDDHVVNSLERFGIPALYLMFFFWALNSLTFTPKLDRVISIAGTIAITVLVIRFISSTILLLLKSFVQQRSPGQTKVKQLGGIMLLVNIFIWAVGILFLFDNMGYNVTTIIAGLGIGGIAIALAAQNILGDLFNYFVIFFDRPFEVDDFLVVDDKNGTVEYIGIKTTRIKTLSGEQLVFANSDLTTSRIHNYKRMEKRRVVFQFGITYTTSLKNLKQVPELVKSIILEQTPVSFDRAHFFNYGESSLDFEVVYFVLDADYNKYMDIHQAINFRLFEEFQKRGIEFAFPTRTVYVLNDDNNNEAAPSANTLTA